MEKEKLVEAVNRQSRFVWIKRLLEDEQTEKIREIRLRGALFFEDSKRVYPKGQFLANVIGFVGQTIMVWRAWSFTMTECCEVFLVKYW
jgi:cell division protein FtsI/penicillin-binding protein 2